MDRRKGIRGVLLAVFGALLVVGGDAYAIIGRPLTPFSYAGVARRTVRRSAYVGAAYGGYGYGYGYGAPAAVSTLPAGCAVGVPCGGAAAYQPAYSGGTVVYVQQ